MAARFDNSDGRIRGEKGKRRRLRLWTQNPHCAACGKLTEYPKGFELDHKQPLSHGGADVDANLQVLCSGSFGCHAKKTIAEDHNDPNVSFFPEWLEPAACSLTIVFGPPGSGKSTYVDEHKGIHDLVIDLDLIMADLAGAPIYQAPGTWLRRAVYLRNRMLSSLSKETEGAAWFITTGQGEADREWWKAKLKPASTVLLDVCQDVCIARIRADDRRTPEAKRRHAEVVATWWQAQGGMASGNGPTSGIGIDGWPI